MVNPACPARPGLPVARVAGPQKKSSPSPQTRPAPAGQVWRNINTNGPSQLVPASRPPSQLRTRILRPWRQGPVRHAPWRQRTHFAAGVTPVNQAGPRPHLTCNLMSLPHCQSPGEGHPAQAHTRGRHDSDQSSDDLSSAERPWLSPLPSPSLGYPTCRRGQLQNQLLGHGEDGR